VLFVAGATLAVGVTVAGRAAWRGSPDGAAPAVAPAPTDTAPAPPAAVDTAQPPAPAEPAADLAAAPAEAAPPAPAPAPPQRKGSRRVAEASVSISARPLVSSPRRVARAEPAPQDDPEPPTHGLPAPLPIVVASAAPRPPVVEDAPAYPGDGFRRPAPADRGCVERALRLPSDLAGPLDGTLTVKFPVSAEGTVGRIEVLGDLPDPRVVPAVQAAIRACRFLPGADAQGKPTALWAVMPLRFVKR
jgi:TonB family protein